MVVGSGCGLEVDADWKPGPAWDGSLRPSAWPPYRLPLRRSATAVSAGAATAYIAEAFEVSTPPMVENAVPMLPPNVVNAVTISAPITAAIRPYSSAVTPRVSRLNSSHEIARLNIAVILC